MRRILSTAAASAISLTPLIASAGTSTLTTNLTLSGTVVAGCTAVSQTSALAFGTAIAPGNQPTAAGAISSTCASGVPAVITFATNSGVLTNSASGATIPYGLFSDTAESVAMTTAGISVTGTGTAVISHVYAKLTSALAADTTTGIYTDTVAVTLTF